MQTDAALALGNCHKIARRKFLLQKEGELKHEAHLFTQLVGARISGILTKEKIDQESLLNLNNPTLQVIVNDFHSRIEKLNEELVNLVIEKDELQVNIICIYYISISVRLVV